MDDPEEHDDGFPRRERWWRRRCQSPLRRAAEAWNARIGLAAAYGRRIRLDTNEEPDYYRARIKPLDNRTMESRRWEEVILKISWTIHIFVLFSQLGGVLFGLFNQLMRQVTYPEYLRAVRWRIILIAVTLLMEIVEILLYRRKDSRRNYNDCLSPRIFLVFQTVKALAWTWEYRWLPSLAQRTDHSPLTKFLYMTPMIIRLMSYYATLAYAIFVFSKERKRRRATVTLNIPVNQASELRNTAPLMARLLSWLDIHSSPRRSSELSAQSISSRLIYWMKYLTVGVSSIFLLSFSERLPGETIHKGLRDAFDLSRDTQSDRWLYPKPTLPARPALLDPLDVEQDEEEERPALRPSRSAISLRPHPTQIPDHVPAPSRSEQLGGVYGPRYLCFLDESQTEGYKTFAMTEGTKRETSAGNDNYVFVSYTRRQFLTQLPNHPSMPAVDLSERQDAVKRDQEILLSFAVKAAKTANVPAFWIDFECVRPNEGELPGESMEEVLRICDIVRGAHTLAIVVGPPTNASEQEATASAAKKDAWLREWGRRLWTVPEALLAPSEHRIMLFAVGCDAGQPEMIAKRNFASRAYDDLESMQQLIDHYEGSVSLTPLQFISVSLECLHRRQTNKTMDGDVSYALQGLLRLRPTVVKSDSDFQAFARLSLANDSDMLLERLICLHPTEPNAPWHDMSDSWGARLWNITPVCEIADIVDSCSISLAAVPAATINWFNLEDVQYESPAGKSTKIWKRLRECARIAFGGMLVYLTFCPLILEWWWWAFVIDDDFGRDFGGVPTEFKMTAGTMLGICVTAWLAGIVGCLAAPALISAMWNCEIRMTDARFFGVEGMPDIGRVERKIFGASHGRMKWATRDVGPAYRDSSGDARVYTLIDTLTLTLTSFSALEPPQVVVVTGRERGMLRAVLCSYDWDLDTFRRETTLRMQAMVLERMSRLERFPLTIVQ